MPSLHPDHNYTAEAEAELQALNDAMAEDLIPAMLYVGLLMVTGIVGNIVVVVVFYLRMRMNTQHFLIISLAVFDLLSCFVAMPTEIADMRHFLTFDSEFACRLMRFVNSYCAFGSILTLIVIAVDRYLKICRPLKRQMSLRHTKLSLGLVLLVALLFAVPALLLYGIRTTDLGRQDFHGHDCSTSDNVKDTVYPLAYNSVLFVAFLVIFVALTVIYVRIWREMRRHNRYMARNSDVNVAKFCLPSVSEASSAAEMQHHGIGGRGGGGGGGGREGGGLSRNDSGVVVGFPPAAAADVDGGLDDGAANATSAPFSSSSSSSSYPSSLAGLGMQGYFKQRGSLTPEGGEISRRTSWKKNVNFAPDEGVTGGRDGERENRSSVHSDSTYCQSISDTGPSGTDPFPPTRHGATRPYAGDNTTTCSGGQPTDSETAADRAVFQIGDGVHGSEDNDRLGITNDGTIETSEVSPLPCAIPLITVNDTEDSPAHCSDCLTAEGSKDRSPTSVKCSHPNCEREVNVRNDAFAESSIAGRGSLCSDCAGRNRTHVDKNWPDSPAPAFVQIDLQSGTVSATSNQNPNLTQDQNLEGHDTNLSPRPDFVADDVSKSSDTNNDVFSPTPLHNETAVAAAETPRHTLSGGGEVLPANGILPATNGRTSNLAVGEGGEGEVFASNGTIPAAPGTKKLKTSFRDDVVEDDDNDDINAKEAIAAAAAATSPTSGKRLSLTTKRQLKTAVKNHKATVIAMSVTVVFFLSFVPHLCLITARTILPSLDRGLRGASLVFYNIFLRSYFINSVSNPIIYGVQNARFRTECKNILARVRCPRSKDPAAANRGR